MSEPRQHPAVPTEPAVDKPVDTLVENLVEDLVDRRVDGAEDVDNSVDTRTGPDLARAVLDAAHARRHGAGASTGTGTAGTRAAPGRYDGDPAEGPRGRGRTPIRRRGYSAAGPDPRDPQSFGILVRKMLRDRGWQQPAAEATLFGRWEHVVGAQIAEHSRPVKLHRGELTIEATSTAWATQLRLLARSLLRQIGQQVGHGVVTRLHIHGPAAPSWQPGPRRVRGPGPRDTYG